MPCVVKVDHEILMSAGQKMLLGTLTMDSSYATSGEALNLTNYLLSTATPVVIIEPCNGIGLVHNKGTVDAGKVLAFGGSVNGLNTCELPSATNLASINASFIAVGQAY